MRVVVSDTSALIDLERSDLLELAFKLPLQLCVPDLLYERELASNAGPALCALGLMVESLSSAAVVRAQMLRAERKALSLPDCFAFALAEENAWTLLTGDGELRKAAEAATLDCHGFFWLFDKMGPANLAPRNALAACLEKLAGHPRCRLPQKEISTRLEVLRGQPDDVEAPR